MPNNSKNEKKSYFKLAAPLNKGASFPNRENNIFNFPAPAPILPLGSETARDLELMPSLGSKTFQTQRITPILEKFPDPNFPGEEIFEFKEKEITLGNTFAVDTTVRLPHNAIVTVLEENFSYDSETRPKVAVAKIRIISSPSQRQWENREVWTTKTNLSQPDAEGNSKIEKITANLRKEPINTTGTLNVPANTDIKIREVFVQEQFPKEFYLKNNSSRNAYHRNRYLYMYAFVQYFLGTMIVEGWIHGGHIKGGLINEVLGVSPIPEGNVQSNDPSHQTVGVSKTPLLAKGKIDYIRTSEMIPIGTTVEVLNYSEDRKFVLVQASTGTSPVWTASSNIKPKPGNPGVNEVRPSTPPAYVRKTEQRFEKTGGTLDLGDWVVIINRIGAFVEISKVNQSTLKPDSKKDWVHKNYLSDGWTKDLMGTHAAWNRILMERVVAKYYGQSELINLGGNGGKAKQLSSRAYLFISKMINDAKEDGVNIILNSGFRTYFSQKYFNDNENQPGFNPAYEPGFSSHQYSYSFDLNNNVDPKVYTWLKYNAWKYDILQDERSQYEKHHWSYLVGKGKEGFYTAWGTKSNENW